MDFLPCCNEAISDFVSGSETNKVVGFVGAEGVRREAEDVEGFIAVPFVLNLPKEILHNLVSCEERSDAAIHQRFFIGESGLLRYARNDEIQVNQSFPKDSVGNL
jgi:hypothetical protein